MTRPTASDLPPIDLRTRAASMLASQHVPAGRPPGASAALRVLHDMAASPATAADALALLHELQVHQVELDLQAEALREFRVDLEAELNRWRQLYDSVPVGCFTIDQGLVLHELNRAGATLLQSERETLPGSGFERFLDPRSVDVLREAMRQVTEGNDPQACTLQLAGRTGTPRAVQARVATDPAGAAFLIAVMAP